MRIDPSTSAPWGDIAHGTSTWVGERGVGLRDTIVLLPFVQLIGPARRAFAARGGWMPRIETTQTLAASLGPPTLPEPGSIGHGLPTDALAAMQTMAREPWGAEWSRRHPHAFARAAVRVASTAHQLAHAASALPPIEREVWWETARALVGSPAGPGGRERLLARVAIEWAARAAPAQTDRLFDVEPAAWIVVAAGGEDRLTTSLLARTAAPTLLIDTDIDPATDALLPVHGRSGPPSFVVCDSFEDEASAAAAQVIAHLDRDERPVALIAQDRVLVRRIRALLERRDIVASDETGWKLSTTRAGAALMALLLAARPDATADAWLDWLKSAPIGVARGSAALMALEATGRRAQIADAAALARLELSPAAAALRTDAASVLATLSSVARRPLVDWLDAFRAALDADGSLRRLLADDAGRQALGALGIDPPLDIDRRDRLAADLDPLALSEFTRWVGDVLEHETFRPSHPTDADGSPLQADVVVTPLGRAMLRPFAAVVLPGADDRRLGVAPFDDSLLTRPVADALGLPAPAEQRAAESLAFAQVLRLPNVTLMRRRSDGGDPLGDSLFVARLGLELDARGDAFRPWIDPREQEAVVPSPLAPPRPVAPPERLPARLSASAFEALRACPYRFYARSILGLGEAEELDPEVEKRDYGSWLHAVLHDFHVERQSSGEERSPSEDIERLLALGAESLETAGLDPAGFLPFSDSFAVLAPRYVEWLHARERRGASWSGGEVESSVAPAMLEGVALYGRIDRIDHLDGGRSRELIDYKTGNVNTLKAGLRDRYEDTQLAFYAALVQADGEAPLRASYLALDGTRGLEEVPHPDVSDSAHALVRGAAEDLRRLRSGSPLLALGESPACDFCEARGLCRRDHWTATETGPAAAGTKATEP